MNNTSPAPVSFNVLARASQPDLAFFSNRNIETGCFDYSLLESAQFNASTIVELRPLIQPNKLPDFMVVQSNLSGPKGMVNTEGAVPWPLIFLDMAAIDSQQDLQEVYIHEAAHLLANDHDHDFGFAMINNFLRLSADFDVTQRAYDYRGCVAADGFLTEDAIAASGTIARMTIESQLPFNDVLDVLRGFYCQYQFQLESLTVENFIAYLAVATSAISMENEMVGN